MVSQLGAWLGPGHRWVSRIEGLGHLFADDVHKALKGLLHVDVVLRTGLKELEPWGRGREGGKPQTGREGENVNLEARGREPSPAGGRGWFQQAALKN